MIDALRRAASEAAERYYRLVLLVGPSGSGKTAALRAFAEATGAPPPVNLNLALAEKLLDVPFASRSGEVDGALRDILREAGPLVVLDNLEMIFSTELRLDPLKALQTASRNRVVVAGWPGTFVNDRLTYAEPGHPESRSFSGPDAVVLVCRPGMNPTLPRDTEGRNP